MLVNIETARSAAEAESWRRGKGPGEPEGMRPHAASALRSARALRTLRLRVPRAATSRSYETLEANPRFRVLPRGSGQSFFIGAAKSGIKAGNRAPPRHSTPAISRACDDSLAESLSPQRKFAS